jgi:DNA-binding NtrC family response regulator
VAIRNCCEAPIGARVEDMDMKTPLMLLVTNDCQLENLVADALLQTGGISHLAHNEGEALEIVCGVRDLDVIIIDFDQSHRGLTLLSAINSCREELLVIVITRDDDKHIEALAYANGASVCLRKPVVVAQVASAIRELQRLKSELAHPSQKQNQNTENESHSFSRTK